jgi:hypothetical protein
MEHGIANNRDNPSFARIVRDRFFKPSHHNSCNSFREEEVRKGFKGVIGFLLSILLLAGLTGCSKDAKSTAPVLSSEAYLLVHILADSTKIDFDSLPKIDASGAEAIQLSEFVDTVLVPMFRDKSGTPYDARELYAYQIVADDGYSAHGTKGYPNNVWSHLRLGHILTATRRAIFPDDKIDLFGAYDVKDARDIYLYRKFDIQTPDTTGFCELREVATIQVMNFDGALEEAVALKDFALKFVANPEYYNYNLLTLDGFGPTTNMTWSQFQTGYWLMDTQKTIFTDTSLVGGSYKLKVLQTIQIVP